MLMGQSGQMTRDEIAKMVAVKFGVDVHHGQDLVDEVVLSLASALKMGRDIELRGLGSFRMKVKPSRARYNPLTKKIEQTTAKIDVEFRPGKDIIGHWRTDGAHYLEGAEQVPSRPDPASGLSPRLQSEP